MTQHEWSWAPGPRISNVLREVGRRREVVGAVEHKQRARDVVQLRGDGVGRLSGAELGLSACTTSCGNMFNPQHKYRSDFLRASWTKVWDLRLQRNCERLGCGFTTFASAKVNVLMNTHACILVDAHTCSHTRVQVSIQTCTHVYMYMHTYPCIHLNVYMCGCISLQTLTYASICIHVCANTRYVCA